MPAYDGDDPDFQDFAWGLLAHESAHIRYSDFTLDIGGSVLRRRLCGAIEDVRIEHELAKDFPGTRLTLATVVDKMIANGGFTASNIDDHPANIRYGYVLKSLRARVLGQAALKPLAELTEAALNARFPKGAVIRLKGLLSEVPDGLTSESDCLHLADRILTMIQQACEQPDQSTPSTPSAATDNPSSDDVETDQADNSLDSDDDGHSEQDEGSTQSPQDDDNPSDASDDDGETGKPDHREILEALLTAGDGDLDQDVFETIKSALALNSDSVSEYVMPIGTEPPTDERAGLQLFQKVQDESGKIRAALQGLVQSHSLSRSRPDCRGRLDGKRLHRLRFGETKVFQRHTVKPAPNTAIC